MPKRNMRTWGAGVVCGLCAATAIGCANSRTDNQGPSPAAVHAAVQQIAPMVSRSSANIRTVQLGQGRVRGEIKSGFENVVLARVNPDGTASRACVDSVEQAEAFLTAKPQAAAAKTAPQPEVR